MNFIFILYIFIYSSIYLFQINQGIAWNVANGQFNNPSSWVGGVVPSGGDLVVVGNGGTCGITSSASVYRLNLNSNSKINMYQDLAAYDLNIDTGGVFTSYNGFLNISYLIVNVSSTLDVQVKDGTPQYQMSHFYSNAIFRGTGTEKIYFNGVYSYSTSVFSFLNLGNVYCNAMPVFYAGSTLSLVSTTMYISGVPTFEPGTIINLNNSSMMTFNTDLVSTISISNSSYFNIIKYNCSITTAVVPVTDSTLKIYFFCNVLSTSQILLTNSKLEGDLRFFGSTILRISDSLIYPAIPSLNSSFYDNSYCEISNSKVEASFLLYNSSSISLKSSSLNSDNISLSGFSLFSVLNSNFTISYIFTSIESSLVTFTSAYWSILDGSNVFMQTVNAAASNMVISKAVVILNYFTTASTVMSTTTSNFTSINTILQAKSIASLEQMIIVNIGTLKLTNSSFNVIASSYGNTNTLGGTTLESSSNLLVDRSVLSLSSLLANESSLVIFSNSTISIDSLTIFDLNSMLNCTYSTLSTSSTLKILNGSNTTFTDSTLLVNNPSGTVLYHSINSIKMSQSTFKIYNSSVTITNLDSLNGSNNEFDNCTVDITTLSSTSSSFSFTDSLITSNIGSFSSSSLSMRSSSLTTMNLVSDGVVISLDSSDIKINGFYQEVSNDSLLYLTIGSLVNPFITVSGSATFKGTLIATIDSKLLNTTSLLRFPLISYASSSGNISQYIIYSIDYENGNLETQINQYCNVKLEKSENLLSLLVSNCDLKRSPIEPCKGTPKCGGTNNGECTSKGCQCISPWTGSDCTSKQPIINPPGTNTTDPSSNINSTTQNDGDISFSSSIGLVELRELDYQNNIIQRYPFSKWTYTNQSTSSQIISLYKKSIIKPNQLLQTNISVIIQWFTKTTEIPFAGQILTMSPSTLKYNIEISKYPFSSLLNRLELVLSASTQLSTNEEQICSQQEFGNEQSSNNTYQYLKIQMNSQSLYGRFINRAVLDNRNVQVDNQLITSNKSSNNEAQIGILIPSYNNLAILDPDFSVLIDTKSAETKSDSICQDNNISKSNKLSKSQIAGIIIGAVGFVGVAVVVTTYFIIKKKQNMKLINDFSVRSGK